KRGNKNKLDKLKQNETDAQETDMEAKIMKILTDMKKEFNREYRRANKKFRRDWPKLKEEEKDRQHDKKGNGSKGRDKRCFCGKQGRESQKCNSKDGELQTRNRDKSNTRKNKSIAREERRTGNIVKIAHQKLTINRQVFGSPDNWDIPNRTESKINKISPLYRKKSSDNRTRMF
ncbi:hypothetical protein ILUMI_25798, partial [Ignelater luminosus]